MKAFPRGALFIAVLATQTLRAEPQQPLTLVKELQVQQAQIADNQTKLDTKIADLAETVRAARIYTSRLGGAHKPPKK